MPSLINVILCGLFWLCGGSLHANTLAQSMPADAHRSALHQAEKQLKALNTTLASLQQAADDHTIDRSVRLFYHLMAMGRLHDAQDVVTTWLSHSDAARACALQPSGACQLMAALHAFFDPDASSDNLAKGRAWLWSAARAGDAYAMTYLAWCSMHGAYGVEKDDKQAQYWLDQAVANNNPWAHWLQASILMREQGNADAVEKHLQSSASQGFMLAIVPLANHYVRSGSVSLATSWLQLGVSVQDAASMFTLWQLQPVSVQIGDQRFLLEQAALLQYPEALTALGRLHSQNVLPSADPQKGFELLTQALQHGDDRAVLYLADAYAYGFGVQKNTKQAVSLVEQQAQASSAPALFKLASYYEDGTMLAKNIEKAIELYQQAAELGYVDAQARLGIWYYQGGDRLSDTSKAKYWLELAAHHQHAESALYLATLHFERFQDQSDSGEFDRYIHWLVVSADLGHPVGQLELGKLYALDVRHYWLATAWLTLASQQGLEEADQRKASMLLDVTEKQKTRRWLKQCYQQHALHCSDVSL